jgi:LssY C-terminus
MYTLRQGAPRSEGVKIRSRPLNTVTVRGVIRPRSMKRYGLYAEAPVSVLLLDGEPPQLVFEKTLNSVNKRHHLGVWQIEETWNGQTVWTAAGFLNHLDFGIRNTSAWRPEKNGVINL